MNKLTTVEKLDKKQIEDFFSEALNIEKTWPNLKKVGENKTICLFFWEPSTRTKLSFEHAAKALGFNVLDFSPSLSSVQKGESIFETIDALNLMGVDLCVLRHPDSVIRELAENMPDMVFVNAGEGSISHPTQALLDMKTILDHKNSFDGLKIVSIGDLDHSRVTSSFVEGISTLILNHFPFVAILRCAQIIKIQMLENLNQILKERLKMLM